MLSVYDISVHVDPFFNIFLCYENLSIGTDRSEQTMLSKISLLLN